MMQEQEIRTPERWLEALDQWAQLVLDGEEAEPLWQSLGRRAGELTEQGEFLPIPYVALAFRLTEDQTKCLCLTLLAGPLSPAQLQQLLFPRRTSIRGLLRGSFAALVLEPGDLEEGLVTPAERIVRFALEGRWTQPDTEGLTLLPGREPPRGLENLSQQLAACFRNRPEGRLTYLLTGQTGSGRKSLARAAALALDTPLLEADGRHLLGGSPERFRRALLREAKLQRCPVLLTGLDAAVEDARQSREDAEALDRLLWEAAEASGLSLLRCREEWGREGLHPGWTVLTVPIPLPDPEESRTLWTGLLSGEPQLDPALLAGKYRLTPGQMRQAISDARALAIWNGETGLTEALLDQGCRRQLRHDLGDKARRVETAFTWEQLILPETSKELLRSACDQVRWRSRVYQNWGFGARLPYGTGLSMLFSGPPGTGKTMGAQVVAGTLGLELYKVELPAVVSKYVGETEKNLSAIFREAVKSQAILFFDEADVLFGKRTEQKDAQDKYSNMEAAYLLQKMEEYPGISILATNFLENFDEAFKRRLTFIIPFPFPDEGYRLRLWNAVFPPETPVDEDVDRDFLARQFELSGSAIKNVALSAAFLAAGEGSGVSMRHLLTALCRELRKSGKTVSREELGPYYILLEEGGHGT